MSYDEKYMVIAVDGTSGSGKSSTSRGVAETLGLRYLDTGAMFRAVTWWMLEHGVDVHDPAAVAARCCEPVLASGTDPTRPTIEVDGIDVSEPIRSLPVTRAVSHVSVVQEVRARLLALQRDIIGSGGIVVEGRDIGTVVWPQAEVKVFLTADAEARAGRRVAENRHLGDQGSAREDLMTRDRIDSGRATAPLAQAHDAVVIDTTELSLDEVIGMVVELADEIERVEPGGGF
jgi:cytidylate kinase